MIDSIDSQTGSASVDLKKSGRKRAARSEGGKVDRLPPHSLEAEQSVLGGLLLENPAADRIGDR